MIAPQANTIFASGYVVPIDRVRERDIIQCYRGGTGKVGASDVVKKEMGQIARIFRITTRDGGHLECSDSTYLLRWGPKTKRFTQVTKLNPGDTIPRFVDGVRTLTTISSIEIDSGPRLIPMQELHLFSSTDGFFAEGFVVRG